MRSVTKRVKDTLGIPTTWEVWRRYNQRYAYNCAMCHEAHTHLTKPLRSVDVLTKEEVRAGKERTDVVAVPAASVVGESALAIVLADAFLEKLGGDFMEEIKERYRIYLEHVKSF